MAKRNKGKAMYAFLESQGALDANNHELMQSSKVAYWKLYRKEWNKEKRKRSKSITVLFDATEWKLISAAAKARGANSTRFLKQAGLALTGKKEVLNPERIGLIREALILCSSDIEFIMEKERIPNTTAYEILNRMEEAQRRIMEIVSTTKPAPNANT